MRWSRWNRLFVALLLATMVAGCTDQGRAGVVSRPSSVRPERGATVAYVEQSEPGDALRVYLHGWMLRYNEDAPEEQSSTSDVSWTPDEEPDDFVSVVPVVSMTDFRTVTVWSATLQALGPITEYHASYRADFQLWRGNPASSAGTGAVPLGSSATYDLSWNEGRSAWVITQTSESPGYRLGSLEDSPFP